MRAVVVTEPGGPEVLQIADVEDLTAGPGELLIRTVAAGVNRADILQRQGHYPPPKGTTDTIGLEVSGHVEAVGDDVEGWSVGDPCVALLAGGGGAELVAVPAGQVIAPPEGVDLVTAAGLVEVAATVVSNMDHVGLRPGETFLVHGGAGGIGSFAIQYAKGQGCRVATTAGSAEKLEVCRKLGADIALDYHDDWVTQLKEATDGKGVDVILDMVGGDYLPRNVKALADEGRLVQIAFLQGAKAELNFAEVMTRRLTITGSTLRPQSDQAKARIAAQVEAHVWPMIARGALKVVLDSEFALDEAPQAHWRIESSGHIGKIVLKVEE